MAVVVELDLSTQTSNEKLQNWHVYVHSVQVVTGTAHEKIKYNTVCPQILVGRYFGGLLKL